jgi:hypothetical protein
MTSPPPPDPAQIQGWLKRRQLLGFYLSRYVTLTGNLLTIGRDENLAKGVIQIPISQDTQIELLDKDKGPRFRVANPNGDEVFLQAENDDKCLRWVLALRSCTFSHSHMTISDFTIISVIGRGFYGKVMLCQHNETKERVAIKTVHKSRLVQSNKVHTVVLERNILSRVNHPFIVSLKFAFQTPAKFYLGLEYAEGGELFFRLQKHGLPPLSDIKLYMAELALALDYLHSHGIIYRDIKPENILLDREGHVKLTDLDWRKTCPRPVKPKRFVEHLIISPLKLSRESHTVFRWIGGRVGFCCMNLCVVKRRSTMRIGQDCLEIFWRIR